MGNKAKNKKLNKILLHTSVFICHAVFVFSMFSLISFYSELLDEKSIKRTISLKFKAVSNIVLWYSLYHKRSIITQLFEKIFSLAKEFGVSLPVRFLKIFIALLVTDFIAGMIVYTYSGAVNEFYKRYFTLDYYDTPKSYTLILYYTSVMMYVSIQCFQTSICYFYSCLGYFLYKMLHKVEVMANTISNSVIVDDKTTKIVFEHYEKNMSTLREFEGSMSRTALILLMTMFLSTFACLNTFAFSNWQDDIFGSPTLARHWYMLFESTLNFLIICYFTILINETDKKMKMTLKNFIKKGLFTDGNSLEWLRVSANDKPFTLSAWGFFHFTKSFLVVTFGSAITYMVLLVQL